MDQTTTRPRARQKGHTPARKASKCTLLLDPDTSRKLSVAADLRGMDRSELVNEVLADALRYIVIQVRGQREGSASPAAGVESSAVEAA